MRIKQKTLCILFLTIAATKSLYPQPSIQILRDSLIERLSKAPKAYKTPVPAIFLDQSLSTNAKYEPDSIILGNVQRIFQSFEDSLSLIYHEYIHHQLHKAKKPKFEVTFDRLGNVVQWLTEESYVYTPYPEEVRLYIQHFTEDILPTYTNYESMSPADKQRIIAQMEKTFAKSQKEFFKYAPSNLALEEIYTYKKQLKGEKMGLYTLSEEVRLNLHMRIKQTKQTYKQRRAYEKKEHLRRSGKRKN